MHNVRFLQRARCPVFLQRPIYNGHIVTANMTPDKAIVFSRPLSPTAASTDLTLAAGSESFGVLREAETCGRLETVHICDLWHFAQDAPN